MLARSRPASRTLARRSGTLAGRFFVTQSVIEATLAGLRSSRDSSDQHEGLVFWGGVQRDGDTVFLSAVIPACRHEPHLVMCDERAVGDAARRLRKYGLGILTQVHSHGTDDARHSVGDDSLILMPFEGMLSIVVPNYGRWGMTPLEGCGIHQFQGGKWVHCTAQLDRLVLVPDSFDLRC